MKILIVDDHLLIREGVRSLFSTDPRVEVFDATATCEALSVYCSQAPDVVLLDLHLPSSSGFEVLTRLLVEDKHAKILVFSMYTEPAYVAHTLNAGACGYISKAAAPDEIIDAIRKVAAGDRYVEPEIASQMVIGRYSGASPLVRLTTREIDIARLLGEGLDHSTIASTLGVTPKTVANACSNIKKKLGAGSSIDLLKLVYSSRISH